MAEVRRLRAGDAAEAINAIHVLKPGEERDGGDASVAHMRELLSRDTNYLYVAGVGGEPAGFLLAYRMPRIDRDQDMVYLYEITVAEEHRRKGIGSALVHALKDDLRDDGVMKMWVGTESDNLPARALYEATGGRCVGDSFAEYTYA